MQAITPVYYRSKLKEPAKILPIKKSHTEKIFVTGKKQKIIKWLIWCNIFLVAVWKFKNPFTATKRIAQLRKLRNEYRNQRIAVKYTKLNNKYFISYNTPAWPSKAFNRYISHLLNRFLLPPPATLNTLVFAITKKCGFQCEHCCEW